MNEGHLFVSYFMIDDGIRFLSCLYDAIFGSDLNSSVKLNSFRKYLRACQTKHIKNSLVASGAKFFMSIIARLKCLHRQQILYLKNNLS